MSALLSDLRFGARLLVKSPLTTAAAILSLALGIGGTTTIFSAVDAVLLRPLPYADPERLVMVSAVNPMTGGGTPTRRGGSLSPGDYLDYRDSATTFEGLAWIYPGPVRLTGDGIPEQALAGQVSGNFFTVLGVRAVAGRTFVPADDQPGRPAQAVLGELLWRRRYGADPNVVGRTIIVSEQPAEVVGVAPASFRFEQPVDLWLLGDSGVPRFTSMQNLAQNRDVHILTVVARLRQHTSILEAQAEMDVVADRLARAYPGTNKGWGIALDPLQLALVGHTRRMLMLLLGAVALMLLIASVNVANLMVVRTQARASELAMRGALGASPGRLVRQILAESAVLAIGGGVLGLALSVWGVQVLVGLAPEGLPRLEEIAVNGRMAAFSAAVTGLVALAFGLWPAWRASRSSLVAALQSSNRTTAGSRRRSQLLLVSGELAIAQVLLVTAGLLVGSFVRLTTLDPGFDPRNLTVANVSLPPVKYRDPEARIRFHEDVLSRISETPGIQSAAMAMAAPMQPPITRGVWFEGRPAPPPGQFNLTRFLTVSETYFAVTGIRLVRGRALTRDDGLRAPDVVVVNEAFVRRYFPGEDPIGRRIGLGAPDHPSFWRTIVGIVADTREQLGEPARGTAYVSFRQNREPWNFGSYIIKSSLPVAVGGDAIRRAVLASDPDQPVSRLRTVEDDMRTSVATQRFTMLVATVFAGLALLLAAVGTFGVMTHVVRGRTRELGVRMALGATRSKIVRLVLAQAARLVLGATAVGLAAAAVIGASIQSLLFEVQARDPKTMAGAALLLTGVALAASYVPIRRALAQNPIAALRDA